MIFHLNCFRSTDTEDYMQIQVSNQHPISFEPPKPPPPPPLPMTPLTHHNTINNNERHNTIKSQNNQHLQNNHQDTATRKQHQPLSAISIQDLNSVQVTELSLRFSLCIFGEKLYNLFFSCDALTPKKCPNRIRCPLEASACSASPRPQTHT